MNQLPNKWRTVGLDHADPLHQDFADHMVAYESLLPSGRANRTRQMLAKGKTVEQIITDWADKPTTDGQEILAAHGLPTAEHLVLKYPERFTALTVNTAKRKLAARIPGSKPLPKRARRGTGSY